jgi:hypothetical protein
VDARLSLNDDALDGVPQECRFQRSPNFRAKAKSEQKPGFRSSSRMI